MSYPPPPGYQPGRPKRDWQTIVGVAFAATISLAGLYGCYAKTADEVKPHTPISTSAGMSDEEMGRAAMEMAWISQDSYTQADLCESWNLDQDLSMDLFYSGAISSGMDPLPSEETVTEFFNSKC